MQEVVSKKNLDDILEEVNRFDINDIQLDAETVEFFKTIQAYLNCFDTLEALYEQVDPTHKLANYDMPDIKLAIQQLSSNGEPVKNLVELYEVAESMFPVFAAKIEALLGQATNSSSSPEASGVEFKLPPGENKLKGKQRASEKAQDDYSKNDPGPPESWLYDIVRGSVLFDNAEQLFEFLELLRSDESIVIVKSKNRFRNPTLSGYRDFNLQIQITNDDKDGSRKHICELQVHINAIKVEAKKLKSHHHYEFLRKYYSGATDTLKERMDDLRVICKGGSLDMTFLANVIQKPLEVEHMKRLADLFAEYMNEYQLAIMITNAIRESLEPGDWYWRMATLLECQGKLNESMEMQHKSLNIRLKSLGPEHKDVAQSYNSIASILKCQSKLDEAMEHYRMALDIVLKVDESSDHTNVANIYLNMANVVSDQGKWEEAMKLYEEALEIYVKTYGPDHTAVALSYNNMAIVLDDQGKLDEAMDLYQKSLGIRLKVLGPDHTDVAQSYNNMASVVYGQGNLEETLGLYQKATETRLKALGPNHPDVAQSYNNMASILDDQGKLEEALDLYQNALGIYLEAYGPQNENVSDSYNGIGYILGKQERLEEALENCHSALDIQLKTLGENHSKTANTLHSIGEIFCKQGKLEEATQFGEQALNVFLQVHGPDHPDTAMGRELMDLIHKKSNKQ